MRVENIIKALDEKTTTDGVIEILFVEFFKDNNFLDLDKLVNVEEIAFRSKIMNVKTKLIALGVIVEDNNVLSLTKEGHKVVKLGSWTAYLKRQKNNDILEKYVKLYLPILGIIITLLLGGAGLRYTIKQSNYNEEKSKAYIKQSQELDSLKLILNNIQLELLYVKEVQQKQLKNP
jgi:hypothetical protein